MLITQLHEREFIETYFPHLLRYRSGSLTQLRYTAYWLLLKSQRWFGEYLIRWLPIKWGYQYFKAVNVLAMRLGQMAFVLGKTLW